ncbi:MAG TPA: phosphotransferase family protein, partial [Acidimicrobiia bacterium]|nr:phosphotransferase family protein [Acidimicrobiia bacterium]
MTPDRHIAAADLVALLPGEEITDVVRGPVGNGQETWFVSVADGPDLVVRRTAESGPLDWTDRGSEYRALQAVRDTPIPTPEPLWLEPEGGRLGRAAFAMTRLPGDPLRREGQEVRDRIAAQLGALLAKLHRLGPVDLGDGLPGSSAGATRSELARWRRQYEDRRRGSVPLMGALLAWLEARVPESDRPATLLWGDAGPHNSLHVDGEITGLLDWELAHNGDPLEDLGGALWAVELVADPEITVAAYEAESGSAVDRDALRWFTVFASVNRGVMVVNGATNWIEGASRSQNHAGLGLQFLREILRQAARQAGWGSGPPPTPAPESPASTDDLRPRPDPTEIMRGVAAFLDEEVLPATEASVLRRGLKTAAALLQTAALRSEVEPAVAAERDERTRAVLDD